MVSLFTEYYRTGRHTTIQSWMIPWPEKLGGWQALSPQGISSALVSCTIIDLCIIGYAYCISGRTGVLTQRDLRRMSLILRTTWKLLFHFEFCWTLHVHDKKIAEITVLVSVMDWHGLDDKLIHSHVITLLPIDNDIKDNDTGLKNLILFPIRTNRWH